MSDDRTQGNLTEMGSDPNALRGRMAAADSGELGQLVQHADKLEIMKAASVADVFTGGLVSKASTLAGFAVAALGVVTVTLEVISRHKFGERYMTFIRLFLGTTVMGYLATFTNIGDAIGGRYNVGNLTGNLLFLAATAAVFIGGIVHMAKIHQRNKEGELWYSHSFGISNLKRLPFLANVEEWTIYRYIEPLTFIVAGAILGLMQPFRSFGTWFIVGGVMMLIRNNAAYQQQRGLQLDVIDSRIISNMVAPIMQGKDPATTAGYAGIAVSRTEAAAISSTPEAVAPTITRAAMREAAKAATENSKSE